MLTMLASLSRAVPFFRSTARALTCFRPPPCFPPWARRRLLSIPRAEGGGGIRWRRSAIQRHLLAAAHRDRAVPLLGGPRRAALGNLRLQRPVPPCLCLYLCLCVGVGVGVCGCGCGWWHSSLQAQAATTGVYIIIYIHTHTHTHIHTYMDR